MKPGEQSGFFFYLCFHGNIFLAPAPAFKASNSKEQTEKRSADIEDDGSGIKNTAGERSFEMQRHTKEIKGAIKQPSILFWAPKPCD